MVFDTNEINKINNGILKLSQYFNGLLSDEDTPINFKNELSNLFQNYKNDTKYRNKKNLKFIGNICNQISNFEYSFDKEIIWFKEGTDLEPKNLQDFLGVYTDIFKLCSDIDLYFEKINPSNNNEDIILLEGDKAYSQFTFSGEDITTKIISNYTIKENSISANYEIESYYLKAFDWIENCKTEYQRRNLLSIPYEDKSRIFLANNILNKIPIYNVFVVDFICNHFDYFENYKKGFKKGIKFFNENYKVSLPNIEQIKQISELYNIKFKKCILSIQTVYTNENIKEIGFENGILNAYYEFENSYINLFNEIYSYQNINKINSTKEIKITYERSSIEDHLEVLKDEKLINSHNYEILIDALLKYFQNQKFPEINETIKFARINKKRLGWILNRIFADFDRSVNIDLLKFCKNNISTFKDLELDENDYKKSNFYKYFTTKTQ